MDQYTQLLYGLAGVAIAGYVAWSVKSITQNKNDLKDLELRITREFVSNSDLEELKKDVKVLTQIVWEIAGKLGVPLKRGD